jgi:type I restriction enzyme M protein
MHWIAPSERDTASDTLEKRLWNAADQFRANSGLTAAQYSAPVLGLIFLLFAETRFARRRTQLESAGASSPSCGLKALLCWSISILAIRGWGRVSTRWL